MSISPHIVRFRAVARREKEPLDGVLRREQEQVELRGSAIVKTTWRALYRRLLTL